MPPRTRKSAETQPPAPSLEDATAPAEAAPQGIMAEESAPPANTPQAPVDKDATQPQAATYHWETAAGTPADPCRLCPPGGPPPGVGSYGCPHGQWVRVLDSD